VRLVAGGKVAVVTNGSQTDPIAEKIALGMPVRDALALVSLTMDFEKDQYDTPRISAVIDRRDDSAWLAVVRRDGVEVRAVNPAAGHYAYVATYEENTLSPEQSGAYSADSADTACAFMFTGGVFKDRTNPVSAVAAMVTGSKFELAAHDAP
jgi:IMP cyclohydrolase